MALTAGELDARHVSRRGIESQRKIIHAAAVCFMRHGLEKATVDEIAQELGSTKGRVYHHFASKNEIYLEVYRQAMEYCFDAVLPLLDLDIPAPEKLVRMATAHGHVMMDTLPFQRTIRLGVDVYLRGSATEAERKVLSGLIAMRNDYEALYRTVLQQGQSAGTLSVPSVALAGRMIMGALNGLVDWYRVRPEQTWDDRDRIAASLAEMIVGGLRAD
ncbi:transcriptional regulator, TetR family [Pseudosulfitobacter pseudonitzschiae]|uniref:TetR family transcriptional regulator n=1 Tax=Pseudosulfitobacter pseudonitzschiae TaxID=1402135 RepID=A0A073J3T6_9RHOB|nr:TetR/AcrR family transcriptional regulator [Pseudosulfitobacter pseudonitzschiae]KEJ96470.1 TetR family transcriptional regulator [Pseudosulfitobacter pseudonitzschiae]QKS08058.1 TetR/AcrR family transcriptional regulator [Pseudosulfitobacter pseudonitzschiae]SHF33828.1 transcriptional regulator, TetR family [Pseudosulfitobacter pseudonitzschiae]